MKKFKIIFLVLYSFGANAQQIADFISVEPTQQTSDFVIPSTHIFQKIISAGDVLTEGGTLKSSNDFAGYVPINGSSENGYLGINSESAIGGVSILDINFNTTTKLWQTTLSQAIDFSSVVATSANCSGTVTPWNTIISCEEVTSVEIENQFGIPRDLNSDGYDDIGWAIEIDPVSKIVINKLWALGNFKHENAVIHSNDRTLYQGIDNTPGYLYKFIADANQDLSEGKLYVYVGSKEGAGNWVQINNTTTQERNTTIAQSTNVGATNFFGIEDVEIGPDGWIYFAVKGEDRVYRFQDSDPISGTTVPQMETYVGNATYSITHANGTTDLTWADGNDNLAFDGEGNLWVLQDNSAQRNYIWVVEKGHTQATPKVRIFGTSPLGSEPTGITFSPDYRFLFMSIQHPSSGNNGSQLDAAGVTVTFDKGTTLVLARKEYLGTSISTWYLDADGDGYATTETILSSTSPGLGYTTTVLPTTDCNDNNATVNPETVWYLDADGDGFATEETIESCNSPAQGYTTDQLPTTDCDDNNALTNAIATWYLDADGDGFAHPNTIDSCNSPGTGYSINAIPTTDCNDNDASVHGSSTWYLDSDGDGFATEETIVSCNSPGQGYTTDQLPTTDCDDNNALINATATWYLDADGDGFAHPNTIDSCNSPGTGYSINAIPTTDCNDNDASVHGSSTWYLDMDGDGFAAEETIESCNSPGQGYTTDQLPTTDCDDNNALINAIATWYLDADGDGFAHPNTIDSCNSPGTGYSTNAIPTTDCNDNDATVKGSSTWYLDSDGDGFATEESIESCNSPTQGYTTDQLPTTDCDDNNALINAIATWYLDADGDGFADSEPIMNCGSPGAGYTNEVLPIRDLIQGKSILYPNPVTGSIHVNLGMMYQQVEISLSNTLNQLLFIEIFLNTDEVHIELANQSSGIYLLQISSKGEIVDVLKIIKR